MAQKTSKRDSTQEDAEPDEAGQAAFTPDQILHKERNARKLAELARQKSDERLRQCFDLGLAGLSITSPQKSFIEVNAQLCQMLGRDRDELLSMPWQELVHPDDLSAVLDHFDGMCAGKWDAYRVENRLIRKDGEIIKGTASVKCTRRPDGSVAEVFGILLDTTRQNQLEAEKSELTRRILGAEQAARDLVQTIQTLWEAAFSPGLPDPGTSTPPLAVPSAGIGPQTLSDRELEVLKLLAAGMTHKDVSNALEISVRTVDTYARNIMQKLRLRNVSDLIHFAIRHDLISI